MENQENQKANPLLSSQEPHQKEEMDQATAASTPSFTLEPEKGMTPEPENFNNGDEQNNLKQTDSSDQDEVPSAGPVSFDSVSDVDLDEDDNSVTSNDLTALNGEDDDLDRDESTMV